MARIFPESPVGLRSDAERRFYEACAALPHDWVVFANVLLVERQYEGEADFVVAHPDVGIVVVEVKGGQVGFEPAAGRWYSIDRHGVRHDLGSGPFEQAQANAHHLIKRLASIPVTAHHRYPFAWAVALPDVEVPGPLGLIPPELILDHDALADLPQRLRRAAATLVRRPWESRAVGDRAVDALVRALGQSMVARRPLRMEIDEIQTQILQLSEEQYTLLKVLGNRREAAVSGCAGSGKTFLATRLARKLYRQGYRVLLTCFNRPLSDWLEETTYDELRHEEGGSVELQRLVVKNYHRLCQMLAGRHGVPAPRDTTGPRDPAWAETLHQVAGLIGPQFDAIIVDEAQDFAAEWWVPLLELREPGGYLYVFLDDNQRIYAPRPEELPVHEPPFWLPRNIRFTRKIHEVVLRFYRGEMEPEPPPLEGEAPDIRPGVGVRQEPRLLQRLLHEVLGEGKVPAQDVVVLTPAGQERSVLREGMRVGNFVLTWQPALARMGAPYVQVSTIHRFKGLERPVVILVELEALEGWDATRRQMLLYVGLSRASARLYVLGGRPEWFEGAEEAAGGGRVASFEEQVRLEEELERAVEGGGRREDGEVAARAAAEAAAAAAAMAAAVTGAVEEAAAATVDETAAVQAATPEPGVEPKPESVAESETPASEVEAVFIDCDPAALEGNPWVAAFIGSGRAYVVDDPPGLVVQAWDGRLPAGRLRIVRRVRQLPFTRSAWLVVVRG